MTLNEFLATANDDDQLARDEAVAFTDVRLKMVTSEIMTMLLIKHGIYKDFVENTTGDASIMATMDRVRTQSDFNFFQADPRGMANLTLVDALIANSLAPAALKTDLIEAGKEEYEPFETVTLHQVKIARERDMTTPVSARNGYVVINNTADCENHNPRIFALNPRTQKLQRIANVMNVSTAGLYDALIPVEWRGAELFVDNCYGTIENGVTA